MAWGIEDAPFEKIPVALANWLGLSQEQRWSLYSLAAAATGDALRHRGIGWRRALMIALTENPVSGPVGLVTKAAPRRRAQAREGDRASQRNRHPYGANTWMDDPLSPASDHVGDGQAYDF